MARTWRVNPANREELGRDRRVLDAVVTGERLVMVKPAIEDLAWYPVGKRLAGRHFVSCEVGGGWDV